MLPPHTSTEIRQLDSERQSLVYNHHHELIAASDTIAAVCDSFDWNNVLWSYEGELYTDEVKSGES